MRVAIQLKSSENISAQVATKANALALGETLAESQVAKTWECPNPQKPYTN